ncbi:MAG: hypothetical protein J7K68_06190, partial [Candidatus Diapherotrites archaeon]|nr:hypothetical protein [Candidatus Diapherotrites archaeon]
MRKKRKKPRIQKAPGFGKEHEKILQEVIKTIPSDLPKHEFKQRAISRFMEELAEQDGNVLRQKGQLRIALNRYITKVKQTLPHREQEISIHEENAFNELHNREHVDNIYKICKEENVHSIVEREFYRYEDAFQSYLDAKENAKWNVKQIVGANRSKIEKTIEEAFQKAEKKPEKRGLDEIVKIVLENPKKLETLKRNELITLANNAHKIPDDVLLLLFSNKALLKERKVFLDPRKLTADQIEFLLKRGVSAEEILPAARRKLGDIIKNLRENPELLEVLSRGELIAIANNIHKLPGDILLTVFRKLPLFNRNKVWVKTEELSNEQVTFLLESGIHPKYIGIKPIDIPTLESIAKELLEKHGAEIAQDMLAQHISEKHRLTPEKANEIAEDILKRLRIPRGIPRIEKIITTMEEMLREGQLWNG